MLLAPEMLSIALCAELAGIELGPIDSMDGPIVDKLEGAARVSAAM